MRVVPGCRWLGVCAVLVAACGAKTGLNVPDVGVDTQIDTPADVEPLPCIDVPFDGGPVMIDLETAAEVGRADVVFLIDRTASMDQEINAIQSRLRDEIAPGIREQIPDSNFAVASFADFPISPYGAEGDLPFELVFPLTADVARAQAALATITTGNGEDAPESQVEALYQLASGEGLPPFVATPAGCPSGGIGYACLRRDALPTVLLFTDDEFHNGPGGENAYVGVSPAPHSYIDALNELRGVGMRVIGFDSGVGAATPTLETIARDTSAVDANGAPLVYSIGRDGSGLSDNVIDAIRTFASTAVFDVDTVVSDPEPADGVDVRDFVESVTPRSAEPADGIESIDVASGTFVGARAGTRLRFDVLLRNDAVVPGPSPRKFLVRIVFRGDGRTQIDSSLVEITVPAADGTGCDA